MHSVVSLITFLPHHVFVSQIPFTHSSRIIFVSYDLGRSVLRRAAIDVKHLELCGPVYSEALILVLEAEQIERGRLTQQHTYHRLSGTGVYCQHGVCHVKHS